MEIGSGLALLAAGIGSGIAILGAGLGIGKIGASAAEGTARQPEAAGAIRQSMLVTAAMIEGVTLIALVVCLLIWTKVKG